MDQEEGRDPVPEEVAVRRVGAGEEPGVAPEDDIEPALLGELEPGLRRDVGGIAHAARGDLRCREEITREPVARAVLEVLGEGHHGPGGRERGNNKRKGGERTHGSISFLNHERIC